MRRLSLSTNALKPQAGRYNDVRNCARKVQLSTGRPHQRDFSNYPFRHRYFWAVKASSSTTNVKPTTDVSSKPISHQPLCCMLTAATQFRGKRVAPDAMASAYSVHQGAAAASQFTITALGRWSVLNKPLPGSWPR